MCVFFFFFFKQKTAYEMRISDWSSDVCSSDLPCCDTRNSTMANSVSVRSTCLLAQKARLMSVFSSSGPLRITAGVWPPPSAEGFTPSVISFKRCRMIGRSEEHTSELQSLIRISYAVFCMKKKKSNHYRNDRKHEIR